MTTVTGVRRDIAPRRDRGMVTAELAAALPALLLVLAVAVGALGAGIDQIRCIDAARLGARALARGDPIDAALATARAVAPPGAQLNASTAGATVTLSVSVRHALPGGFGGVGLGSSASADREVGS
ncbi:MAG: TadE family type IV pilus minor pilin [Dermatophilaceae bacterium]